MNLQESIDEADTKKLPLTAQDGTKTSGALPIAACDAATSSHEYFDFLALPLELRRMVYRIFLSTEKWILTSEFLESRPVDMIFLRVSRQFSSEALSVLGSEKRRIVVLDPNLERWTSRFKFALDNCRRIEFLFFVTGWFGKGQHGAVISKMAGLLVDRYQHEAQVPRVEVKIRFMIVDLNIEYGKIDALHPERQFLQDSQLSHSSDSIPRVRYAVDFAKAQLAHSVRKASERLALLPSIQLTSNVTEGPESKIALLRIGPCQVLFKDTERKLMGEINLRSKYGRTYKAFDIVIKDWNDLVVL